MTQGPPVDPSWAPPTRADEGAADGDTQPVPRHQDTQPIPSTPSSGWDQQPTPLHGVLPAPVPAPEAGYTPSWPPPAAALAEPGPAYASSPPGRRGGLGTLATIGLVLGCLLVGVMGGLLGDQVGVLHSLLVVGALAILALAVVPAVRKPSHADPVLTPRR